MVQLEIFSGAPPCPGCVAIVELAQRVAAKYEGELELVVYEGPGAAVVNGTIRIEGMCPSEATLNNALREGGLCLK